MLPFAVSYWSRPRFTILLALMGAISLPALRRAYRHDEPRKSTPAFRFWRVCR